MAKASDNAYPSILVAEGTEPSAPAAGHQRLYIDSTTHRLKATNSSGADRTTEAILTNFVSRTAGDISITNDGSWHDIGTISDLSIAAIAGDVLEFTLDSLTDNSVRANVVLVTSGNNVGNESGQGIVSWANRAGGASRCGGSIMYTVVSGDISSGLVAARLRYTTASSGATKFFAGTSSLGPLFFGVKNLKQ